MDAEAPRITLLLAEWAAGDANARSRLIEELHPVLDRIAARYLGSERAEHTLEASALVNEAYLRVSSGPANFANRAHFVAAAASAMRRVLVDHARRRTMQKRDGKRVSLSGVWSQAGASTLPVDVIDLETALDELARLDPRLETLVEMRFYGGLTIEETAAALEVSLATAKRDWLAAKTWLRRRLRVA
jgi:RNA polymerase sigma factor (TIGR02999 family)